MVCLHYSSPRLIEILTYVFFLDAGIMTQEAPLTTNILVAFRSRARSKEKDSLEMVVANNCSIVGASGLVVAPTEGSEKRKSKTIVSTTRSPQGTLRRPPSTSPIQLGSMSPVSVPSVASVPLGNAQFSKGVQVGLTPTEVNMLVTIPSQDLLSAAVEMHARAMVLTRLAAEEGNQRSTEEISQLEHFEGVVGCNIDF